MKDTEYTEMISSYENISAACHQMFYILRMSISCNNFRTPLPGLLPTQSYFESLVRFSVEREETSNKDVTSFNITV